MKNKNVTENEALRIIYDSPIAELLEEKANIFKKNIPDFFIKLDGLSIDDM